MNHSPYELLLNDIMNNPDNKTFTMTGTLTQQEQLNLTHRMDFTLTITYDKGTNTTTITKD